MKKRSTLLQLMKVLDVWTEGIYKGYPSDTIYLDFKKAFDKMPHERLTRKLNSYGFTSEITGWIRSFLTNRKQHVSVNGSASDWSDVTSGIPQESVLGPILFIIYINDIVEQHKSEIYLFADDAKVFRTMTNACAHSQILQQDIDKLC